jgi:hypothetical protein
MACDLHQVDLKVIYVFIRDVRDVRILSRKLNVCKIQDQAQAVCTWPTVITAREGRRVCKIGLMKDKNITDLRTPASPLLCLDINSARKEEQERPKTG